MTTMIGLQFIELYLLEIINLTLAAVNYRSVATSQSSPLKRDCFLMIKNLVFNYKELIKTVFTKGF